MRLWKPKFRALTFALITVNVLLLFLIGQRALQGTRAAALIATPAETFKAPRTHVALPEIAHVDLTVLQSRALFHASRSFFVPPPPPPMPIAPPRPDYRFAGLFVIPNKPPLAMLSQNTTGVSRKVKVGDELEGWRVQAIESQRIVLQFAQETFEITRNAKVSSGGLQRVPLMRSVQSGSPGGARMLGSALPPSP
jgi:hypothetical protein